MAGPTRSNGQRLARIVIGMLLGVIAAWFLFWILFGVLLAASGPR